MTDTFHGARVVRASPADVTRLAPLFDAYRSLSGAASDLGASLAFLRERLERNEAIALLALPQSAHQSADANAEPLAFVLLYPLFSSVRLCRILLLNDLYVVPAARGQGLGRLLMEAAEDTARAENARWMILKTSPDNSAARDLIEYFREVGPTRVDAPSGHDHHVNQRATPAQRLR
jgi:GNAT superfamily N-acetyltransferase